MAYTSILLLGVPYCGKDYVAERIIAAFGSAGLSAEKWQVGDYYYATLSKELGISIPQIKAEKPKYRAQLQTIGNDPASVEKGIAWANSQFDCLRDSGLVNVVVARRDDEIEMLKARGAFVIYITARVETIRDRALKRDGKHLTDEQLNHPLERKLEDVRQYVDWVLHNNDFNGPLKAEYHPSEQRLFMQNYCNTANVSLEPPPLRGAVLGVAG